MKKKTGKWIVCMAAMVAMAGCGKKELTPTAGDVIVEEEETAKAGAWMMHSGNSDSAGIELDAPPARTEKVETGGALQETTTPESVPGGQEADGMSQPADTPASILISTQEPAAPSEAEQLPEEAPASEVGSTPQTVETPVVAPQLPEPAVSPAAETPASSADAGISSNLSEEIMSYMNEKREEAGLAALSWNEELAAAAAIRSSESFSRSGHVRPDGSMFFTVSELAEAENLAKGSIRTSAKEIVDMWMASTSGHRENIMDSTMNLAGVAVYASNGKVAICVLFG